MNTEIQVNSSNIQNILIALVLISAIIYGFIEFRKVNMRVQELENKLKNIEEGFSTSMSDGDETQQYPPEFYQMMAQQEMMQGQKEQQEQPDEQPVDKEQQNEVLNTIVEEQVEEVNDEQQTIKRFDVSNKRVLSMINNDVEVSKKGNNESIEDITDTDDAAASAAAAPAAAAPAAAPAAAAPNEIDISEPLLEVSSDIMNQYKDSTIKELKDKLTELGLSTTGSKTKLVQRLAENQN